MPKFPAEIQVIVDDFLERLGAAYPDEPDHSNILGSVHLTIAQAGLYGTGTETTAFADGLKASYEQK
jgi:hypothetical protein